MRQYLRCQGCGRLVPMDEWESTEFVGDDNIPVICCPHCGSIIYDSCFPNRKFGNCLECPRVPDCSELRYTLKELGEGWMDIPKDIQEQVYAENGEVRR